MERQSETVTTAEKVETLYYSSRRADSCMCNTEKAGWCRKGRERGLMMELKERKLEQSCSATTRVTQDGRLLQSRSSYSLPGRTRVHANITQLYVHPVPS